MTSWRALEKSNCALECRSDAVVDDSGLETFLGGMLSISA